MAKSKTIEQPITNGLSNEDLLWAHKMLQASGMTDEIRLKVESIYKQLFNEDLVFSCCKNRGYIKLDYHLRNVLKIL
jgi:hypothetical protein